MEKEEGLSVMPHLNAAALTLFHLPPKKKTKGRKTLIVINLPHTFACDGLKFYLLSVMKC